MAGKVKETDMMYSRAEVIAQDIAYKHGLAETTTEVLALAVLEAAPNVVTKIMSVLGVDPQSVKEDILALVPSGKPSADSHEGVAVSQEAQKTIRMAEECCSMLGDPMVGVQHLILACCRNSKPVGAVLERHGLTAETFRKAVSDLVSTKTAPPRQPPQRLSGAPPKKMVASGSPQADDPKGRKPSTEKDLISRYCRDLNQLATEGKLDVVVGRDVETSRIMATLLRRKKNNPLLIGDPGVGKTAVVEGLAQRIVSGRVPPGIRGKRIYALNILALLSQTVYRGQFEERMRAILDIFRRNQDFVLFVDEVHTLLGAGSAIGGMDAANILKPPLANGEVRCIGATTEDEYRKIFRKDGALDRRFQRVVVPEPSESETMDILRGCRSVMEGHYGCRVTDDALAAAYDMTRRYVLDRHMPDKAIDCLDEACVMFGKGMSGEDLTVGRAEVAAAVARQAGVAEEIVRMTRLDRVSSVEAALSKAVVGQDAAVKSVVRVLRNAFAGVRDPKRPIGSLLFAGPPSTGKSHVAEEVAEALFGSKEDIIRVNMSEYQEHHYQSRLIGSPPGYVGYGDKTQLADRVIRRPYSVVLFEGIEHAHSNIVRLVTRILSDGMLVDAEGRHVSFRNAIVVMTMSDGFGKRGGKLGFCDVADQSSEYDRGVSDLAATVRRRFGEDLANQIDDFVLFSRFDRQMMERLASMRLAEMASRVESAGFSVSFAPAVAARVAALADASKAQNAKAVDRVISSKVEPVVAEAVGRAGDGCSVAVACCKDGFKAKERARAAAVIGAT